MTGRDLVFPVAGDDLTVDAVEEVCWRVRATGGLGSTVLRFEDGEVRALDVDLGEVAPARPARGLLRHAEAVGFWAAVLTLAAFGAPVALRALLALWGWAL